MTLHFVLIRWQSITLKIISESGKIWQLVFEILRNNWSENQIDFCVRLSLRCLVHILKENSVRYSKIRPLSPQSQLDLCRHEVRYGCVREDECFYAHSLIELKVWMMQHGLGKTALWPFNRCMLVQKNMMVGFILNTKTVRKTFSGNIICFLCILFFYTGITHESIVQEAKKYWNATASLQGAQVKQSHDFISHDEYCSYCSI